MSTDNILISFLSLILFGYLDCVVLKCNERLQRVFLSVWQLQNIDSNNTRLTSSNYYVTYREQPRRKREKRDLRVPVTRELFMRPQEIVRSIIHVLPNSRITFLLKLNQKSVSATLLESSTLIKIVYHIMYIVKKNLNFNYIETEGVTVCIFEFTIYFTEFFNLFYYLFSVLLFSENCNSQNSEICWENFLHVI